MFFSKRDWKGSRFPLPKRQINKDNREMFYIGRSDIDKKKVYFIVSGHIIPDDRDSHVFPNSFFRQMVYNKEYDIPQESKDILFQNVQYTIRNKIEYIYPSIVNETKQWQCKLKGGRLLQPKSLQWIQDNFQKDFEETYEQLISDEFIDKPIPCPESIGESIVTMEKTKVPIPFNMRGDMEVKYCFGEKDCCAFGNMANAMYLRNDSKASSFFFSNRFQTVSDMNELYTPSEGKQTNFNAFQTAIRIVREKFGYVTKALDMYHQPWLDTMENTDVVKYIEMQGFECASTHVICVYNGHIYDGALGTSVKLSRDSMKWIIGDDNFALKCYAIEESTKTTSTNEKGTTDKKRKRM